MYYYLVGALKRRLILELQDSFGRHPVYRKISPFIQNRFHFSERPQFGIVVQGSSTNKVQWAPDNFVGTVASYVMLAHVGQPSYPLEWVREDLKYIKQEGGMPTLPGVYFLEILQAPTSPGENGYYAIDPMLTSSNEAVLRFQSGIEQEAQLQQAPIPQTLRLWEDNRNLLVEGTDFNVDYGSGALTLLRHFSPNGRLTADYRYAVPSIGPVAFQWNTADFQTLPGIIMAFGKRAEAGNKIAIVVYQDRVDTAQAFGGKFEANFDLQVIARDTMQMEEIADLAIMYLWGEKKSILEFEGIEILDVSMGGEAEELADETGENFFYQASLSVSMRADWELHVPLPLTISQATQIRKDGTSGLQVATGDMFFRAHPIIPGRNVDFERIT